MGVALVTFIGELLLTPWGALHVVERVMRPEELLSSDRIGLPVGESSALTRDPLFERRQERQREDYAQRKGEMR